MSCTVINNTSGRVVANGVDITKLERRVLQLELFIEEFIDAWDSGVAGDSYLYRMAKDLTEAKNK